MFLREQRCMSPASRKRKILDDLFAAILTLVVVGSLLAACDEIAQALR